MEFRLRPAGRYMLEAGLNDLYLLTRRWSSDLDFFRDEIRFMIGLVSRYAAMMITDEHVARVNRTQRPRCTR
jgi:hypothetical protein